MEKLNRKLFAELIDVRSSIYDELVSAEIITVGNDELSSAKKSEIMEYAHNQALETLDSFISKYEAFLLESEETEVDPLEQECPLSDAEADEQSMRM